MGARPFAVVCVCLAAFACVFAALPRAEEGPSTLVVYVASVREPGALENARYFLRHGAGAGPGGVPDASADYVIVADAQSFDAVVGAAPQPVPPNVRFERMEAACHTAGMVGGALQRLREAKALARGKGSGAVRAPEDYRYVVWLDSTLRGPFLPVYLRRRGGPRQQRRRSGSTAGWGAWIGGGGGGVGEAGPSGRSAAQLAPQDVGGGIDRSASNETALPSADADARRVAASASASAGSGTPAFPPPHVPVLPFSLADPPAWHELLTSLLTDEVKLVGSTISCRPLRTSFSGASVGVPHVQGSLSATDRQGLRILEAVPRERAPFGCHPSMVDAVRWGEIGPSEAMFERGKTIGSLMARYDGVDFRDPSTRRCNGGLSPLGSRAYDGGDLHPLEAMFVKSSEALQAAGNAAALQAERMAAWEAAREDALEAAVRRELEGRIEAQRGRKTAKGDAASAAAAQRDQPVDVASPLGARAFAAVAATLPLRLARPDVESNAFGLAAPAILEELEAKGNACFDAAFYLASEPFEFGGFGPDQAWEHFVNYGFREGRPYRFVC